jgi:hypothetical protein
VALRFRIIFADFRKGLAYYLETEPDLRALDVQPTLIRMTTTVDPYVMTLMPGARWVLVKEARVLTGLEAMRIQGCLENVMALSSWPQGALCHLTFVPCPFGVVVFWRPTRLPRHLRAQEKRGKS